MTALARNIVVIVADQLRPDHLRFGGSTAARTPRLDELARQGTVFERTFVANPICMPNRATIATGRWPSAHGTRTNGIPLDPAAMTFQQALREAGWTTAAVGKLHFQNMGWPFPDDQLHEMRATSPLLLDPSSRDSVGRINPPEWARAEDYELHRADPVPVPVGYYGFDTVTACQVTTLRGQSRRGTTPLRWEGGITRKFAMRAGRRCIRVRCHWRCIPQRM